MRSLFLVLVVLGGCVTDAEQPPLVTIEVPIEASIEGSVLAPAEEQDIDVCGLAAALPVEDICSLICDPFAMAARMADDGSEAGRCYQLYCTLSDAEHVLVGVCLPP